MVNSLSWYLALTCFIPDIIEYFPLLLHACIELSPSFLYFVCWKGHPFKKKKWYIFPHCGGVWQWEKLGELSGLSFSALAFLLWIWLLWWVFFARRWPLIYWCNLWWLGSFLFNFQTASFSVYVDGHLRAKNTHHYFVCWKGHPFKKKKWYIFPHCGGVWQWEKLGELSGLSFSALAFLLWIWLLWWVFFARRWPLIYWCNLWWLGSFLFNFSNGFF